MHSVASSRRFWLSSRPVSVCGVAEAQQKELESSFPCLGSPPSATVKQIKAEARCCLFLLVHFNEVKGHAQVTRHSVSEERSRTVIRIPRMFIANI